MPELLSNIISKMQTISLEQRTADALRKHEYNKTYFQENKGSQYPREKKYRDKLRCDMVEAYGSKCVRCGESDSVVLVLDHIDDDGFADRIVNNHKGGYRMYAGLKRQGWPKDKHQLLCHNCNYRKEYYRRNPCLQEVLRKRV